MSSSECLSFKATEDDVNQENKHSSKGLRRLFVASAWAFVVAAAIGVLFRWGMLGAFPFALEAPDIRHGHSHLMLMGWATPALMALMAQRWPAEGGRRVDTSVCIMGWTAWGFAAASVPPFLLYGYDSVAIGSAEVPLAAILSGLAIFAWYGFAAVYFGANRGVERTAAMRLWDIALGALVVSSAGAWAVAALMMAGVDSVLWESVTVHFFVDLFGAGWLLVGTLGVLRADVAVEDSMNERIGRILVGSAVAFVFLVGLPRAYTPEVWPLLGSAAAGLCAAGLLLIAQRIWSRTDLWGWRALLFLFLTTGMLAAVAIPPLADWGLRSGMRLFYLHVSFAGFVTLGLVVAAHRSWGRAATGMRIWWLVALSVLLVSMIPLTGLWPSEYRGDWVYHAVFVGAVVATVLTLVACMQAAIAQFFEKT